MDDGMLLDRLRRLDIKPKDVLVLKADLSANNFERFAHFLKERLDCLGISDVLIIHLTTKDCDLEALDEDIMREQGWIRTISKDE